MKLFNEDGAIPLRQKNNKYINAYNTLLRFRISNEPPENVYCEVHHILPRSLGGSDDKENLVKLTAREHYMIHVLLAKIFPENRSLSTQAWFMTNSPKAVSEEELNTLENLSEKHKNLILSRQYTVNSRIFQAVKTLHVKHASEHMSEMYSNGNAYNQNRRGYTTNGVNRKMFLQNEIPQNENWILCERFNEIFPEFPKKIAKEILKENNKLVKNSSQKGTPRKCFNCGEEFVARTNNQICCCRKCTSEILHIKNIYKKELSKETVQELLNEGDSRTKISEIFEVDRKLITFLMNTDENYITQKTTELIKLGAIGDNPECLKNIQELKEYNENVKPTKEQINFCLKVYRKHFENEIQKGNIKEIKVLKFSQKEQKMNIVLDYQETAKSIQSLQNLNKSCQNCQKEFNQKNTRVKYCSEKCSYIAKLQRAQEKVKSTKEELQELLWKSTKTDICNTLKIHHSVLKFLIEKYNLSEPPVGYFISKQNPEYISAFQDKPLPQPKEVLQKEVFEIPLGKLQTKYGISENSLVNLLDYNEIERPNNQYWQKRQNRKEVKINRQELYELEHKMSVKELQEYFGCGENTIRRRLAQ